jgi:monofunctional biosynthetic peptidoglycan transglycosylase
VALGVYAAVFPPITTVQLQRRVEVAVSGAPIEQTYAPVPLSRIDPDLPLAVVAGEDSRFFLHGGIDWTEVGNALRTYWRGGGLRGASTITQQLVKNLFLTTHSTVVRKALEVPLTVAAELLLSKRRILELYVNVIEWGPGVYGAQAAARYHYGTSARYLTRYQAAALAACIPDPLNRRPQTVGHYQRVILDRMAVLDPLPISRLPAPPRARLPHASSPASPASTSPHRTGPLSGDASTDAMKYSSSLLSTDARS